MMTCKSVVGKKAFLPRGKYFFSTREEFFSHEGREFLPRGKLPGLASPALPEGLGAQKKPALEMPSN